MVESARVIYYLFLLITLITHVFCQKENTTNTCIYYYEKGVEAYLDNKFDECVLNFENSLDKYRDYGKKLQNCRIKCRQEAENSTPLYPVDIENLLFYEKTVKTTLCIVKCKREYKDIFGNFNINKDIENLFENKKPYEYLHICYFQNKEAQKAANAAYTYLVSHPDDKVMSANLKYYSSMEGVDISEVVNYEAKDFLYLYLHGVDAYERKDWNEVIQNMEESLLAYLHADDECRAQCEGPFDQGWYPDFVPSIANHFTYCLRCKRQCASKLDSLNGEKHDDLLPSHYHYLQYAYFKSGNLRAACAAVASYLLFYPKDETMLDNKYYYSKLPKGSDDLFTPRPEAVYYVQRQMYEKRLYRFILTEFSQISQAKPQPNQDVKYRIIMTEKQLNGPKRFLSDGLLTTKQCQLLINIVNMFAILGDGYGKKSPHTPLEKFEGITINRATLLVYFHLLNPKSLELILNITTIAKEKIQQYFNITQQLYFTYTHLVCRSALSGSPHDRRDFSHEIHADNCVLLDQDYCPKTDTAYTWRDYSAIIYLNDNFDGGEFIFSSDPKGKHIQSIVYPKCGRMVAFSSGVENIHGVKAVKSGSRCAIALWFTYDKSHEQSDQYVAFKLLKSLAAI